MPDLPVESFIIDRLQEGGWRVIQRRANLTDLPIADFVSYRDAKEWVNWKSGQPRTNLYVTTKETSPQPRLVEVAIEPRSKADAETLSIALAELAAEDPAFEMSIDPESGQIILKGANELHLDAKLEILRRTYRIDPRVGALQVAFRECITRPAEVEYAYKKQSDGSGQFAAVKLRVEPNQPGEGYRFESRITGGAVPKNYIPGIEKGIESVLPAGVVAGYPVVDIKVELIDGKYHDTDSSALAFEIAARAALREALQKAGSLLLEPIMTVEVVAPEECIGLLIGDLNLRRGQIRGQDIRSGAAVISAMVPLINMFGYANNLLSLIHI